MGCAEPTRCGPGACPLLSSSRCHSLRCTQVLAQPPRLETLGYRTRAVSVCVRERACARVCVCVKVTLMFQAVIFVVFFCPPFASFSRSLLPQASSRQPQYPDRMMYIFQIFLGSPAAFQHWTKPLDPLTPSIVLPDTHFYVNLIGLVGSAKA